MSDFKEEYYKVLVNEENFYMKQYYSNYHKKEIFLAMKELKDGIYCVLICDEENEFIDYSETIEYIKTVNKPFSLNMIVLSNFEHMHTNPLSMANRLVIDKANYNVIACDEACKPLKQIIENMLGNISRNTNFKAKFLKHKILTLIIVMINIIMFIFTQIIIYNTKKSFMLSGIELSSDVINKINNYALITLGAKYNPLIASGEVWRLITCAFLHSGLMHIGFNMYSLYIIGPQINQIYGTKKYLIIYAISCITSSSLSYIMTPSISVGASGGIFGLMGALLIFAIMERKRINRRSISSIIQVILLNLFIGVTIQNIDNFAHIGGLIGGLILGYLSYKIPKRTI